MKKLMFGAWIVSWFGVIGCADTVDECEETECKATIHEIRNWRIPTEDGPSIIVKCSYCDEEGCNHLGARCEAAGAACNFHGDLGVCTACCDSEYGELHCGPRGVK